MSIWHREIVQNATYTVVLAIFCFPKRGHFGKKNMAFLIRFGLDRKSLRCYVYTHFSDFEVSKNAFLFVFARRRFCTFFLFWLENVLITRTRMQNGTPPFKIELPKKDRKMRSRSGQKTDFGGPFSVWSGGLNVLKTRIRPSNVVFGGVWWERLGHSDFKCWN